MAMRRGRAPRAQTNYARSNIVSVPVYQPQYATRGMALISRPRAAPNPALVGRYRTQSVPRPIQTRAARVERKTFDLGAAAFKEIQFASDSAVAVAGSGFTTTDAGAHVLNQVPQGNTSTTRIGKKISMRAILIRGRVYVNAAVQAHVRLVLVYDRNPNASAAMPPFTTIFSYQGSDTMTNIDNASRFKVIRNWEFPLICNAVNGNNSNGMFLLNELVSLRGLETHWTSADTTGVFSNMEQGALYIYALATTGIVVAGAQCYFDYASRLYYTDL